jgi:NADH dehydrogenase
VTLTKPEVAMARTDVMGRRVVIVGAGFAGLSLAKDLKGTEFDVTLIDRHNYHLFQPLLYQVATSGLSRRPRSPRPSATSCATRRTRP